MSKGNHVPPAKPCMWEVMHWDELCEGEGPEELISVMVGPCKTAFDAWRLSKLPGDFGSYTYEPLGEK